MRTLFLAASSFLVAAQAFALPLDAASLNARGSVISVGCNDWSDLDETSLPSSLNLGTKLSLREMERMAGENISESELENGFVGRTMRLKTLSCGNSDTSVTVQFAR